MMKEILSQPQVLTRCFNYNKNTVISVANQVIKHNINNIILAARGSSDNACTYFKYICEIAVGIPVCLVSPSVFTMYDGKMDMSRSLVVGVSQSGKAADVLEVLERANIQGAITLAITNDLDSPLAAKAQYNMFLNTGKEISVAATKTFSAQLLSFAMLNFCLAFGNIDDFETSITQINNLINEVISLSSSIDKLADIYIDVEQCIILTRGISLCAGQELALKIQETCYINARCYPTSDFHHGPYALINDKSQVIVLAFDDVMLDDSLLMLKKLQLDKAKVTLFTNNVSLCKYADNSIVLPSCDNQIAPFVVSVCGQLFACLLSSKRGIDPDKPRSLNKITITR